MKTRAAVFRKAGEPISMETIDVRSPGPHEVLVEFKATGLCHTDLSVVDGVLPWSAPVVLGHEGAGVVLETGPGVTRVTAGDHFISHSLPQCGHCPNCHSEKTNCCEELLNGNVLQRSGFSNGDEPIGAYMGLGTFANFAILNEDQIAPINRDAPLDKVCTIGCALVTGVGSALYSAEVEPGSTVLVIGMGQSACRRSRARASPAQAASLPSIPMTPRKSPRAGSARPSSSTPSDCRPIWQPTSRA